MTNGRWLISIVLVIALGYMAAWSFFLAFVGVTHLSWQPNSHQMHPVLWGLYIGAGVLLLYSYRLLYKYAKTGKWLWQ